MIAKPVATAGTWGRTNATRAGAERREQQRPQAVEQRAAGLTSGSEDCVRALASSVAIGGEVSARRPSQIPISAAITHQPAATGTTQVVAALGGAGERDARRARSRPRR